MLARYKMYRGSRPASDPMPRGIRQDTRRHTRHILRPTAAMVAAYLASPSSAAWARFEADYLALLEDRFNASRKPFDDLAALAEQNDVYIGCSCPTKKNPDPRHCHTYLALEFMRGNYPHLDVC